MDDLLELQQTLYSSRNPTRRWLHCTRRDRIEHALRRASATTARGRVLEVGPGSGVYLPLLASLFDEVVAADIEDAFLDNARLLAARSDNLTVVTDDITSTQLPAQSFDVVLCSEVIEHIEDSPAALRGMHHVLRSGGLLVLSTPQRYSPLEIIGRVAFLPGVIEVVKSLYREPVLATGHINLLTPRQAYGQVSAAGFEVVERSQSGVYLPLVAELTGRLGLRCEQWLERLLAGGRLSSLLWTQYYTARA